VRNGRGAAPPRGREYRDPPRACQSLALRAPWRPRAEKAGSSARGPATPGADGRAGPGRTRRHGGAGGKRRGDPSVASDLPKTSLHRCAGEPTTLAGYFFLAGFFFAGFLAAFFTGFFFAAFFAITQLLSVNPRSAGMLGLTQDSVNTFSPKR